jgi:hypothetical protein
MTELTDTPLVCDCPFCPVEEFMKTKNETLVSYFFVKYNNKNNTLRISKSIIPENVDDTLESHLRNMFLYYHQNQGVRDIPANMTHTSKRDIMSINIHKTKKYFSKDGESIDLPIERNMKIFRMCIHIDDDE